MFSATMNSEAKARSAGQRSGFTIIELLVVISIIGTLLAVFLPAIQYARQKETAMKCSNKLRILGQACHTFRDAHGFFPRNTVRPRGTTQVDNAPEGNLWNWNSGTYESWPRQLMELLGRPAARVQDAVPALGCPADPRGIDYTVPDYGFTWYVGVYSNPETVNNGVIVDDSDLDEKSLVYLQSIKDGMSNTIMLAERPPSADGDKGWWDSRCCIEDTMSPARGSRDPYSSGRHGQRCPDLAYYGPGEYQDRCAFNRLWSYHPKGANFCLADGSVRTLSYEIAQESVGEMTLLEALASRNGSELVTGF